MVLHLGNDVMVNTGDVVGIFDADSATVSQITKKYLSGKDREGAIVFAKEEIPKSFVLYKKNGKYEICFSQLSSATLVGRIDGSLINNER